MIDQLFTKDKSQVAKGLCIRIMWAHHLFAFPDRIAYVFDDTLLIRIGKECGIIVGLYVFISAYGLSIKPLSYKGGGRE